jgi:hypothetical protein
MYLMQKMHKIISCRKERKNTQSGDVQCVDNMRIRETRYIWRFCSIGSCFEGYQMQKHYSVILQ